jgi:peptide-methionine (R)-S-oxide reductase
MLTWPEILNRAQKGNLPAPRRVERSEEEWKQALNSDVYAILRQHGTERPFSSEMCSLFEPGRYACAGCGEVLFDSESKFESGTGWPSFTQPVADNVIAYLGDFSRGMARVETLCAVCDGHLGHVFPDGPKTQGGLRFCMNALALAKVSAPK